MQEMPVICLLVAFLSTRGPIAWHKMKTTGMNLFVLSRFLAQLIKFREPLEEATDPSSSEDAMEFVRLYRPSDLEDICMQVLLFDNRSWVYDDAWYQALARNSSMLKLVLQHAYKPFQDLPFQMHAKLAQRLSNNYVFDPETIRIALAGLSLQNDLILKRNEFEIMETIFEHLSAHRPFRRRRSEETELWTDVLAKVVRAGIDLNGYTFAEMPGTYLCMITCCRGMRRKSELKRLMSSLASAGVDLLAFATREIEICYPTRNPFDEYDWQVNGHRLFGSSDQSAIRSCGFSYGATPEEWDFWHTEAVYYEYAEDFWHMIENP
jgi:hypothetical protein